MELRLIILSQCEWQGKAVSVRRFPFLIGQGPNCQFRVTSTQVAPQHCVLVHRSGRFWVRDLESGGRTFLNGWRVTGKKELKHGDRLRLGPLEFGIRLVQPLSPDNAKELENLLRPARLQQRQTLTGSTATRTGSGATSDSVGASPSEAPLQPRPSTPQSSASVQHTPSAAHRALQRYFRRPIR
jgi:pSer/pThr/pTyr-binding forkhead associated (FHA) protein